MKFGVRDICDVVFKAKDDMQIGSATFVAGQPVFYIDTATASSLEQATTTNYANGGKGNTRLVAWEGEKTLTFNVTDALISPISLSVLAGANLYKAADNTKKVHMHMTSSAKVSAQGSAKIIDLSGVLGTDEKIDATAPIFISGVDTDGDITGVLYKGAVDAGGKKINNITTYGGVALAGTEFPSVFVDFYVQKDGNKVSEIQLDSSSFGGNFYVEASTLFRSRETGTDMPAELTFPNVKIQSGFSFSMSASGDPSTFDFVMDALPGYTYFDNKHKVMCVIQMIDDAAVAGETGFHDSVMLHDDTENYFVVDNKATDSVE